MLLVLTVFNFSLQTFKDKVELFFELISDPRASKNVNSKTLYCFSSEVLRFCKMLPVVVFEAYFLWNFVCAEAIHNCMNR